MLRVGKLLLLFTVVPLLELYLLGKLSAIMGLGNTIGLVLVTGIAGASLARAQGRQVLQNWQQAIARGEVPESGVTDALLVVIGGVLLVTPGVMTDVVGLSLLLPPPRRLIGRWLVAYFQRQVAAGHIHIGHGGGFGGGFPGGGPGGGLGGGLGGFDGPNLPDDPRPLERPVARQPDEIRVKATVRDVDPDADDP